MEPTQNKLAKPLTIAGVIVLIAGILGFVGTNKDSAQTVEQPSPVATSTPVIAGSNKYKDGTFNAEGNYISPGGAEKVGVSLTLKDDIVVDSIFTVEAKRSESIRMQTAFSNGYKQYVIGKNIDDISVSKVSGSSLTPKGFNDAVTKIKVQATI